MNDELTQLAKKYGSDRQPGSKHSYTPYYFKTFSPRRNSIKKVLEIGVGEGRGLRMWRDFFPHAQIYGAENMPSRIFKEDRIEVFPCDQTNRENLLELLLRTGTDLDIVIDDASHKPLDQIFTCKIVLPFLKQGAIYVIEDVADAAIVDSLREFDVEIPELLPKKTRYDDRLVVARHKNTLLQDLHKMELQNFRRVWAPFMRKYDCNYICEIGVDDGGNFMYLTAHEPKLAVAVDCWIDDHVPGRNENHLTQSQLDQKFERFNKLVADKPYVQIIRDYSLNAAEFFPDNYFDFVYIDADHSYEACYADICAWYPKVKPGKFLVGHDYRSVPGVVKAVNQFLHENNLTMLFLPHSNWIIVKK